MKKNIIVIFLIVLFPLLFLLFFGKALDHKFRTLPYYHPSEIFLDSVDNVLGKAYTIPDFKFYNHNGELITRDGFENTVYLVVPVSMNSQYLNEVTQRLLSINFKYKQEEDIKIYCLSIDDKAATNRQARKFMEEINSNLDNSKNIYVLSADEKSEMEKFIRQGLGIDQLVDSPYALLIDPKGQIRGRYHLNIESHISDAKEDIALLRKEISIGKFNERKNQESSN